MSVRAKLDGKAFESWIKGIGGGVPEATKRGMRRAAQYGFDDSQRLVHVKTGNLKASGYLKETAEGAEYGYLAEYAAAEEYGNAKRPAHPYVSPGYRTLQNGLAAEFVFDELTRVL